MAWRCKAEEANNKSRNWTMINVLVLMLVVVETELVVVVVEEIVDVVVVLGEDDVVLVLEVVELELEAVTAAGRELSLSVVLSARARVATLSKTSSCRNFAMAIAAGGYAAQCTA